VSNARRISAKRNGGLLEGVLDLLSALLVGAERLGFATGVRGKESAKKAHRGTHSKENLRFLRKSIRGKFSSLVKQRSCLNFSALVKEGNPSSAEARSEEQSGQGRREGSSAFDREPSAERRVEEGGKKKTHSSGKAERSIEGNDSTSDFSTLGHAGYKI